VRDFQSPSSQPLPLFTVTAVSRPHPVKPPSSCKELVRLSAFRIFTYISDSASDSSHVLLKQYHIACYFSVTRIRSQRDCQSISTSLRPTKIVTNKPSLCIALAPCGPTPRLSATGSCRGCRRWIGLFLRRCCGMFRLFFGCDCEPLIHFKAKSIPSTVSWDPTGRFSPPLFAQPPGPSGAFKKFPARSV